jgi:uncharacterized protein YkwD
MSRKLLFVLLVVICLNLLVAGVIAGMVLMPKTPTITYASPTSTPEPTAQVIVPISAEKLMSTVNNWRSTQGFQVYTSNNQVCSLASKRASDARINFSHDGFIESIPLFFSSEKRIYLAENLSKGYDTEQETLDSWLTSTEHRKNLDADYKYSCIRCEGSYCAQIFANL